MMRRVSDHKADGDNVSSRHVTNRGGAMVTTCRVTKTRMRCDVDDDDVLRRKTRGGRAVSV